MVALHRILPAALILLAAALRLSAAEKLDLERVIPVPATATIPLADFFRPRLLQEPKLNLSGTHIAALITAGSDKYQLLVVTLQTQKMEFLASPGDTDIYDFQWLNDERLIYALSSRKLFGLGLFAANVGRLNTNYPLLQYYGSSMVAVPLANRLQPLIWAKYDSFETAREGGVVAVDTSVQSGKFVNLMNASVNSTVMQDTKENNERHILRRYAVPEGDHGIGYLADKEGRLGFAFTATNGLYTLHQLTGETWRKCPVDLESIDIVGAGDQAGQLVVIGPRNTGKPRTLQLMDAATGQLGAVLLQDEAYDFEGWLYRSPGTRETLGAVFERNGPRVVWFNEDYRKLQKLLDGYFPGLVVRIIGSDEAQKLFLVSTFSDRQPATYKWVDLATHTIGLIKNSAPWIDPARMRPMSIIKFKTRDGRHLDAYLTLPAGASKQEPPPLVVLSHGGPWVRDTWGFDGEVQFLASRGYAVLQPNYRGSTGYDWMFPEEDRWDFRKMHDDVTDAVKGVIGSGLVDPGRIAIMGGSFGGYLAVSGVVNEPSLYRCAVTIAGVFDWERQINDKKYNQYDSPVFARLIRKLGDPRLQKEKFEAISPGRRVDQIRVPVFVSGGKDDFTVEIEQSQTLIASLEKFHVPHEVFIVREEGHGMSHLDNQVELYSRIEAFLAKNLAKSPLAATPPSS